MNKQNHIDVSNTQSINQKLSGDTNSLDQKLGLDHFQNKLLEHQIYEPYFLNNNTLLQFKDH